MLRTPSVCCQGPELRKSRGFKIRVLSRTPKFLAIPFPSFWPCSLHQSFVTKASVLSEFAPWSQHTIVPLSLSVLPSSPVLKGGHRGCDWLALLMGGGKANDPRSGRGPHAVHRAADWRGSP